MPSVRSTVPSRPKSAHCAPVAASRATSRASTVPRKMRRRHARSERASASSHVETPRDVATTTRRVRSTFASQAQRSFPVSASSAMTRLYGVLKKSVPSTMSGVASKA